LEWEPWSEGDLAGPRPGTVYVVNVSFLQMAPAFFPETLSIARGWVCREKLTGRVGDSWYYFEIPGSPAPEVPSPLLPSAPYFRYFWGPDGERRPFVQGTEGLAVR